MRRTVHAKIAGVTFDCPKTGMPRQEIIRKWVHEGTTLVPVPEPENQYSDTAVGLWLPKGDAGYHVGYLKSDVSPEVFDLLQRGVKINVVVHRVTGGLASAPTRGVNVDISWDAKAKAGAGKVSKPMRRRWLIIALIGLGVCFLCSIAVQALQ